ncbi:MAG: histone deacetylase [Deltaproteobacteria bacterium]|nr:histone deacetylase [Deltaproteobacteria bacterium]
MAKTAVVIDKEYLKHLPGEFHPERPERIKKLLDLTASLDGSAFRLLPPRAATRAEIEACHSADHFALVESTSRENQFALDGDTVTCRDSFGVGLLAVGGFLNLLDVVAAGESQNGFALVRPPGHHARPGQAMGFCLFNTMAIGAEYLKREHGARRVLVMDWDVHHGNGTQEMFYQDPSVLFISTHQYPFYPGTGAAREVGAGAGEGYTINVPLPAGCADGEYLGVFRDIVAPAVKNFQPDWILVSAGFDPHKRDPLSGMSVTEAGFGVMARVLLRLAEELANSKIAFLLEGGYDLTALSGSVMAVLNEMRGPTGEETIAASAGERIQPIITNILNLHEKYR